MSESSLKEKAIALLRNAQEAIGWKPKQPERPSLPVRLVSRPRFRSPVETRIETRASFDHS